MVLLAGWEAAAGRMGPGDVTAAVLIMTSLYMPLNFLGFAYREVRQSFIDMEAMLATLVDKEAQRALDAGRYGIRSIRSMLGSSIQVINTVIGLVAAAGVLLLLHPVLVLALLLIAAPKAWGAVAVVRRNYASRSVWLDHVRATDMVTYQLSRPDAGPEVKAHRAGELLTGAYEDMAATAALGAPASSSPPPRGLCCARSVPPAAHRRRSDRGHAGVTHPGGSPA